MQFFFESATLPLTLVNIKISHLFHSLKGLPQIDIQVVFRLSSYTESQWYLSFSQVSTKYIFQFAFSNHSLNATTRYI